MKWESGVEWRVERCGARHSVWLSDVETVARLVRQGAGEGIKVRVREGMQENIEWLGGVMRVVIRA